MGTLTFLFCSILFFLFSLVPWWIMIDLRCSCTSPGTHFCREGCFSQGVPKNTFLRLFLQENRFSTCFQPRRTGDGLCVCHPGWGGSDCERCAEGGLESVVAEMLLRWLLQREVTSQRLKQLRRAARLFVPSSGKRRCGDACLLLSFTETRVELHVFSWWISRRHLTFSKISQGTWYRYLCSIDVLQQTCIGLQPHGIVCVVESSSGNAVTTPPSVF